MSQKTDPTSLRLQKTNKHYSSSWYSDCFYSQMNANDLQIRSYIEAISKQVAQSQMFPYIQRYYKRVHMYLFLTDTREIRNQREKALRLLQSKHRGHKYVTSTTTSTAFLRSRFDSERGMLPFSLPVIKDDASLHSNDQSQPFALPLVKHGDRSAVTFNKTLCASFRAEESSPGPIALPKGWAGDSVLKPKVPTAVYSVGLGMNEQNMHQDILTELSDYAFNTWKHNQRPIFKNRLQAEKAKIAQILKLMPYWYKKGLQELPPSKLSLNQTPLIKLDFKYSILRDLIAQNCKESKENRKLFAYLLEKFVTKKTNPSTLSSLVDFTKIKSNKLGQQSLSGIQSRDMLTANMSDAYFCPQGKSKTYVIQKYNRLIEPQETIEATLLLAHKRMRKTVAAFVHGSLPVSFSPYDVYHTSKGHWTLGLLLPQKDGNGVFAPNVLLPSKLGTTSHSVIYPQGVTLDSKGTSAMKNNAYNLPEKKLTDLVLTSIHPVRVVQDIQFAGFLAQEIVHLLQKGASFKQIQTRVLGECTKNEIVKGIRVSCSGRMGGRSKKAQKSKMQSVQWGETSLHVLSSKLSFASASASTPFGKVGIKLWLCFM